MEMSFQDLAEQCAAYAQRIMELERQLGECSGAVQTMERQIEQLSRSNGVMTAPDKHKQALRELKALASLYGNPGWAANKLLDVVAELLEIER
jgi:CII-binding regulator of phage lambda lysogenization HflD